MKMKGLFSLVFILAYCQISVAQIKSQVSECFELVSIAFRLADAPEYVNNQNPAYVKDIDCYFAGMERSVEFMKHLGRNRDTRSITLHDYMSQVVGFINYTAEHFEEVVGEFRNRHPYIVEIFPASNSTVLSSDMETIEIRFSEPMATGIHGISYIEDEKVELLPYVIPPSWKDEYTFQIRIDKGKVENEKVICPYFNSKCI